MVMCAVPSLVPFLLTVFFLCLSLFRLSLCIPISYSTSLYSPHSKLPVAAGDNSSSKLPSATTTHYFQQELDHFTFLPNSSSTFYQKYLLCSSHWDPAHNAPIFVYAGNEGDIDWFAENTGFMFDIAPEFNALLVFIEHRFYGDSKPFGNDSSKSAATLGYLTSTQALADYAVLIRSLKQNLSAEASPVVLFGGSYGGMLAAWFRLKYPHIALGALASSAPILAFDDITPWSGFYDAVSQDFKDESLNCFNVIKGSWDELFSQAAATGGLPELSKTFRACQPVRSVYSIRDWIWNALTYTAMVDYPTPANFLMNLPAYPVRQMCKIIDGMPAAADSVHKVFAAVSLYYNYTGDQKCFAIENMADAHGLSGWVWQACTEMVMPLTASKESMFPESVFDYKQREDYCLSQFGVRPRPHWITTEFGGYNIDLVLKSFGSNIIFSNGLRDPWSRGGVLKNISSNIVALVTKKGAHHLDLRYATEDDPSWLKEQRSQEIKTIRGWIDQYYQDYHAQEL